jgi:hypothetical protein
LQSAKLSANHSQKLALGLAPMGHKEPAPHCNITYQTHMEDIQWSGGNWYGLMHANQISFGSDLLAKCQTFSQPQSENWNGLTPMGQKEPAPHCNITYQTNMEDIQWSGGNWYGLWLRIGWV